VVIGVVKMSFTLLPLTTSMLETALRVVFAFEGSEAMYF